MLTTLRVHRSSNNMDGIENDAVLLHFARMEITDFSRLVF